MTWLRSTIGMIVTGLGLLLIVVAFLYLQSCADQRRQAAQSKVDRGQAGAFQNSSADAVNTAGGVATNQAATEDLTRRNERTIRDAKGADQGVDPAVRDAGLASLCRRPSFRNSRTGRLRCTPSGGVAPAR
jgi:hypothetical protein